MPPTVPPKADPPVSTSTVPKPMTTFLLTGDIGGTNSRMALYTVGDRMPLVVKYYRNQQFLKQKQDGIFERNIIAPFLQQCWEERSSVLPPIATVDIVACLAVAGPVRDNKVSISNLHRIEIDGTAIVKQTHVANEPYLSRIRVCTIINDFVAQGFGCLTLAPNEVVELMPGSQAKINPNGPRACVGAGTGLGECYLTPNAMDEVGSNTVYSCFPSEGGHVEYAPRNDLEVRLWKYLKHKFQSAHRVSVERVVSGRGLANCYEFLAKEFPDRVDQKVHQNFLEAGDMQGKIVAENAQPETLCYQAMEIMMSAYGSEVGSASIKFIPTGGMYVTGGLTPKNLKFIQGKDSPFMKAYLDKGRVSPLLETVPLFAVLVEDLGVRGAYKAALMSYERLAQAQLMSASSGTDRRDHVEATPPPPSDDRAKLSQNTILLAHSVAAAAIGVIVGISIGKKHK